MEYKSQFLQLSWRILVRCEFLKITCVSLRVKTWNGATLREHIFSLVLAHCECTMGHSAFASLKNAFPSMDFFPFKYVSSPNKFSARILACIRARTCLRFFARCQKTRYSPTISSPPRIHSFSKARSSSMIRSSPKIISPVKNLTPPITLLKNTCFFKNTFF